MNKKFASVEEYIASFDIAQQKILTRIRNIIRKAAPQAKEIISYNMPAYKQNRVLVYFAMAKNHLGFYPTASGIQHFEKELYPFTFSKGAIQFPLNKPLPKDLIKKIVVFRAEQDAEKIMKTKDNDFLFRLPAPTRRALQNMGITTLKKLAAKTETEILQLHGIGKTSIPILAKILQNNGLHFRQINSNDK